MSFSFLFVCQASAGAWEPGVASRQALWTYKLTTNRTASCHCHPENMALPFLSPNHRPQPMLDRSGKKVIGELPKDRRAKCSVDCRSTSRDPFLSVVLFFIYYGGITVCPVSLSPSFSYVLNSFWIQPTFPACTFFPWRRLTDRYWPLR